MVSLKELTEMYVSQEQLTSATSFDQNVSSSNHGSHKHTWTEEDLERTSQKDVPTHGPEYRFYAHKEIILNDASDILEVECGEPVQPQHLRIDFNPLKGFDDSEYMLDKCISFWKLVEKNPMIQHLKVKPQKNTKPKSTVNKFTSTTPDDKGFKPSSPEELPGLEMVVKKGNIINNIFATKMHSYCEEGGGDFLSDAPYTSKKQKATNQDRKERSGRSRNLGNLNKRHRQVKNKSPKQHEEVIKLCREMEDWDMSHHKSMEPPGHQSPLFHAQLQKNYH